MGLEAGLLGETCLRCNRPRTHDSEPARGPVERRRKEDAYDGGAVKNAASATEFGKRTERYKKAQESKNARGVRNLR